MACSLSGRSPTTWTPGAARRAPPVPIRGVRRRSIAEPRAGASSKGSRMASTVPLSAREYSSRRSRMPIAASTDSSARRPWLRARGGRFGSRCASSVRAFATARGLRSSWATKLANRESRRRSSSSLPTSRSSSTAPPPGIGVPSTSTITSRPDIGMRMTIRRRTDRGLGDDLGPLVAGQEPAVLAARLGRAAPLVDRSLDEAPAEEAQRGAVAVRSARLAVVHDQWLGDRLRDLLESRAIAFRLRASALESPRRWPRCAGARPRGVARRHGWRRAPGRRSRAPSRLDSRGRRAPGRRRRRPRTGSGRSARVPARCRAG